MRSTRSRFLVRHGAHLALVAGLCTASFAVSDASAQGKPTTVAGAKRMTEAQKKDAAKKAYGDANEAFKAGKFDDAYRLFTEADSLVPGAVPKFRAAESLDQGGKPKEAIAAYEAFLASNPEAAKYQDRIDAAKARIAALKSAPAELTLAVTPPDVSGLVITVDGVEQSGKTLKLSPGKHLVTLKAPGFEDASFEADVAANDKREMPIELKAAAAVTPPPAVTAPPLPPSEEPESDGGGNTKIPAYITLGVAGAGLIVGTIFGISALSSQSDYEANPTQEGLDDTERNALIADMAFGASIAFGITGAVLLLTSGGDEEEAAATASKLKTGFVAPYVTTQGGGAAARMSF